MTAAIETVRDEPELLAVHSPYDGAKAGEVIWTAASRAPELIRRAKRGAAVARALPRHARADVLDGAAARIAADQEGFARLIVAETGKTITQARKEVGRCCNTLRLSADEARRNAGEVLPFDAYAGSAGRLGWFSREPLGVIAAITPYNDPLNLAAHKLGPAIAGGNAVILKPSELSPLSAFRLADVLVEAGLPADVVTVVAGGPDLGQAIVASRVVRMVTFTGGFETGERIAAIAGLKKVAMDLGGNAPVIVMADCDLERSVSACVSGAFWAAGQNCIGAQRLLVEQAIYPAFRDAFVAATQRLVVGDPHLDATDVGPMISPERSRQTLAKIDAAVAAGAVLLAGGKRKGSFLYPTVLERPPHDCAVWAQEAFAPLVTLEPFAEFEDALRLANATEYSLHAGIFTSSLQRARDAADRIEAAGVMINDSSDFRFDAMPFGGYKYGSLGREGVRFAYEDMTQPKVVCFNSR